MFLLLCTLAHQLIFPYTAKTKLLFMNMIIRFDTHTNKTNNWTTPHTNI